MLDPIGALDQSCSVLGDNGTLLKTFWIIMKLDLYNNHETFIAERKQDWDVARWLKRKGIKLSDLDDHTNITDVITLIQIREELWYRMNLNEQATWGAYWSIVYGQRYPLTEKFWKKFDRIVKAIDDRDQLKAKQRLKIQSMRDQLRTMENMDDNNEAKASCLPQVTNTKRESQECRAVPYTAEELWW